MKLFSLLSRASAEQRSFVGDVVYRLADISQETIELITRLDKHQPIDFWAPESLHYLAPGQTVDLHLQNPQR